MLTYVTLFKWTDEGAKTAKETVARNLHNQEMAQRLGGRIVVAYWTQGAYDLVAVTEWPDEDTAQAAILQFAMQGLARTETLRAFTAEDMQRIIGKLG